MPQFKVTGPGGRRITITGDTMPSEQELDQIFSGLDGPGEVPESSGPSLLGRGWNAVSGALSVLNRPESAMMGALKEGVEGYQQGQALPDLLGDAGKAAWKGISGQQTTDFNDVLAQGGMDEGWKRATLGFVGDVALDPLNLIGPGVGKLLTKGAAKVGNAASKLDSVNSAKNVIQKTFGRPAVAPEFINTVEGAIEGGAGGAMKGLSYDEMSRLAASQQRAAGEYGASEAAKFFESQKKNPALKDFAYAVDEARSTGDAAMDALKPGWKQTMDDLWAKQLELGHVDPESKITDYVQYHTRSGRKAEAVTGASQRALPNSARERKAFDSLKDAVKFGDATDNPVEILSHSIAQVEKAKRADEFLREVKGAFGKSAPTQGYRELNLGNLHVGDKLKADLKGVHLPVKMADDLERSVQLWQEPNELMGFYKNSMKVWKAMATAVNFSHHPVNFMGNIHNMYIAGMDFKDMARWMPKATKVAKMKTMESMPEIAGHSKAELWKLANQFEIIGTTHQLGETVARGKLEKIANNPVFAKAREMGTKWVEEPARLAFWLNEIEKGASPAKAALRTKDVLFDYAELSKAERAIRDSGVVPFYTWMRKNIPLQIESMIKNPQRVEKVGDLMEIPWNAKETQMNQAVIPERAQNAGYVPSLANSVEGAPVLSRLPLPMYDVNKLTDMGSAGDMLGPVVKTAIEGISGEKFFGGKIKKPSGLTTASTAASLLSPLNYVLPDSMEGYITPKVINGRPMQNDVMSWLMTNMIPTGVYGSTARASLGEDPTQPHMANPTQALGLRLLGMAPDALSAQDQAFEAKDRVAEWKRKQLQRILLEK